MHVPSGIGSPTADPRTGPSAGSRTSCHRGGAGGGPARGRGVVMVVKGVRVLTLQASSQPKVAQLQGACRCTKVQGTWQHVGAPWVGGGAR
jgi:hypothetical protein